MKRTKFQKALCLIFCLVLMITVIPVTPLPLLAATEKLSFTPKASDVAPEYDVRIFGESREARPMTGTDVAAMQVVLTADALAISTSVTSYGNDTGSVTMALFAFDTDYDISLLNSPVAEYTFVDFPDGGDLALNFSADDPLPAGEYILVLYDMKDSTPTANGGSKQGIGIFLHEPHEGQRSYVNGAHVSDCSMPVSVKYATTPEPLYGIPTKPSAVDVSFAPHMGAALDFRKETTKAQLSAEYQSKASYVTEGGESYLRLKASKDASDPFQFISLPNTVIKCSEYKYVAIRIRRTEGSNLNAQLYFITDETDIGEAASIKWVYEDTADWQTVILNLGDKDNYIGSLKALRLDYFQDSPGEHHVDVQYIALFRSEEAARAFYGNFDDYADESYNQEEVKDPTMNPDYSTYVSADAPADTVDGKLTANGQLGYMYKDYVYAMDFSQKPEAYAIDGGYVFVSVDNAVAKDGRLLCKAFTNYAFYTKHYVGDAYGIRGGALEFDMVMESGSIAVTLRQMMTNDDYTKSGIRFTLDADGVLTVEEHDGLTDTVQLNVDLTKEHHFAFADQGASLSLMIDGAAVYTLTWERYTQTLTTPAGASYTASRVADTGYAAFSASRTRGYVDNVSYTYTDIVKKTASVTTPVDYSTWVAIDDLDRTTPTHAEVGADKGKYVGIFYFLTHSADTWTRDVNDVTKLYLEGGTQHVTSTLSKSHNAYWAEPYFGYYSSLDTWVFRKHAYMLDAAGVDFIFLDVSNNTFHVEQAKTLFDTWKTIRDEGGHTPQIAFMYGDMPFTLLNGLYTLLEPFYNNPEYQDLLFCWEGKPLVLGNKDTLDDRRWTVSDTTPQTKDYYRAQLEANPLLNTFYEKTYKSLIKDQLTVRKCWAWQAGKNKSTYGYWDWLQESPQALGTDFDGNPEQISVSMGVHAHTNTGRSYLNGDNSYNTDGNYGFTLGTARYGYFFAEQFDYALTRNVDVVMITGWNEWWAGVQKTDNAGQTCGATSTPNFYLVDQLSPEYSRDGEPMKIRDGEDSVGFGDNYYYQMVSYIRKFKGLNAAPATVNGGSLSTAEQTDWEKVSPAFTDTAGDVAFRNQLGWGYAYRYTNGTARNDLNTAKISQDNDYIYFHVTTASPLITVDDELWMNLYVDTDNDLSTGWEGFDYMINRSRTDKTVSVEKFVDGKWVFETVGEAEYTLSESSMTVKVAKTMLGCTTGEAVSLHFKWADNADVAGDVMRFMDLGDTAPNDRFVFAYTASTTEDERNKVTETETETDTSAPESETGSVTTSAPETEFESETESETEPSKGCRSSMGVGGVLVAAVAGLMLTGKRKREDD